MARGAAVRRACAVRLAEGEPEEPTDEDSDLMAELRLALGNMDASELAASDERVLDGFVDDRKGVVSAFEEDFGKQLDAMQESIESRIEGELSSVQSEFLERIDAAVGDMRQSDAVAAEQKASAAAAAAAAVVGLSPAELPTDALIVVAGATTPLGGQMLRAIGAGGYQVRALVPDGKTLDAAANIEQVAYAPFAPTALGKSLADAAAVVLVMSAASGAGGIEPEAVPKIVKALDSGVRRVIMVSIHGVERTDKLPFNLQNVFGQLDKQRAAEQELVLQARQACPAFTILRIGKLTEAPPTAPPAAAPATFRADLEPGDALGGELAVDAAAAVLAQSLARPEAVNATFSVGPPPDKVSAGLGVSSMVGDDAYWDDQWLKLVGPEVYRRPLNALPAAEMAQWLRDWARLFLRPGQQLTTPVAVKDVDDGVLLRFLTRASGYADFDAEESNDDAWAAAASSAAGEPDGALLLVAESLPTPRVRVTRAEMAEGVLVKEMSETAVLLKLERDISALEAERRKGR